MVNSFEVMGEISRYLQQEVSAKIFRGWMVGAILEAEKDADELTVRLLAELDCLYAQFSDGYLAELSLRKELVKLLLSNRSQSQSVSVEYSFLRSSFINPLPPPIKVNSNETTATSQASKIPNVEQELVAA